jgi:hypothetical protein
MRTHLRNGAWGQLFPALAWALTLGLIAFNKVGSPQFAVWLVAPMIVWLTFSASKARLPAILTLAIALSTQLVYPLLYDSLLALGTLGLVAQSVRAVLLLTAFILSIVLVWRQGSRRILAAQGAPIRH